MLYYLFNYLDQLDFPGAGMFKYVSFRSALVLILSLFISTAIGRRIIDKLQLLQIGETVRNLGLEGQMSKKGTPTMGGIIIIIAIVVPTLLCAKLTNIYVILMLVTNHLVRGIGICRRLYQSVPEEQGRDAWQVQDHRTDRSGADRRPGTFYESGCGDQGEYGSAA